MTDTEAREKLRRAIAAARVEKVKRDAILTRGVILNHYAAVEFSLDELLFRLRRCEEYRPLFPGGRIKKEVSEKIELAAKVLASPGRLDLFAKDLIAALEALEEYTMLRHMAAHGILKIDMGEGECEAVMTFEKFAQGKTDLGKHQLSMNAADVAFVTARLSLYARTALRLLSEANSGLPRLDRPEG